MATRLMFTRCRIAVPTLYYQLSTLLGGVHKISTLSSCDTQACTTARGRTSLNCAPRLHTHQFPPHLPCPAHTCVTYEQHRCEHPCALGPGVKTRASAPNPNARRACTTCIARVTETTGHGRLGREPLGFGARASISRLLSPALRNR